jgi:hypothetical protein
MTSSEKERKDINGGLLPNLSLLQPFEPWQFSEQSYAFHEWDFLVSLWHVSPAVPSRSSLAFFQSE